MDSWSIKEDKRRLLSPENNHRTRMAEGKILKNCIKEGSKTVYSNLRTIKIRNI